MKILFLSSYAKNFGGVAVQMSTLQKCLQQEGVEVDILGIFAGGRKRLPIYFYTFLKSIFKYQVIHLHIVSNGKGRLVLYLGVFFGKLFRKRVVITFHSGNLGRFNAFVRWFYRKADCVSVMSECLYNRFKSWHFNVLLIPNIAMAENTFEHKKKIFPNFICTRTLHNRIYRISSIIKSFEIIKQSYPQAVLFLIGSGKDAENLKLWVKKRGTQDVIFMGSVNNSQIYYNLRLGDIYLNASSTDTLPTSIIEALNAGLLVISTDVGGIPDMIKDGQTGYLVPVNGWQLMAQKAIYALQHQEESLQIIHNAYLTTPKYRWAAIREKSATLYNITFS